MSHQPIIGAGWTCALCGAYVNSGDTHAHYSDVTTAPYPALEAERERLAAELAAIKTVRDETNRLYAENMAELARVQAERDRLAAQLAEAVGRAERLRAALKGIQQMAADDIRVDEHGYLWQIEADARAALAADGAADGR